MYRVNETWTFFISHIHLYIHDLPKDILRQIIYRGIYIYKEREENKKNPRGNWPYFTFIKVAVDTQIIAIESGPNHATHF